MRRLSKQELSQRGKAARKQVGRRSHAEVPTARTRGDAVSILAKQDATRLPELLGLRYARMSESPFTFLRGSAAVMAADLSRSPTTAVLTQLCGDAHILNVETFATPERRLVFDITDFDETARGPFEWDLKRMATSLVVAARAQNFDRHIGAEAVYACLARYRSRLRNHRDADFLDVWYANVSAKEVGAALSDSGVDAKHLATLETTLGQVFKKARKRTSKRAARRLTETADGRLRIREDPPVLSRNALGPDRQARAAQFLKSYAASLPAHRRSLLERFEVVDAARRVVGVGSVGTRCYVILLHGRDASDPLVLQVKEAGPSVLTPYISTPVPQPHGRRVVEGQRIMQTASDIFIGWLRAVGPDGVERDFYMRQFRDMKGSIDIEDLDAVGLVAYAELCGHLLADAHARGGHAAELAGYLGKSDGFIEALIQFAQSYADVTEQDHARLCKAIRNGQVPSAL